MKKGNKVIVKDGSYSQSVVNGELVHEIGLSYNKQYTVIETNCKFPTTDRYQTMGHPTFNNTVIQAIDSGKVVFIEERFLELVSPTHKVMLDIRQDSGWMYGQIVEISDKLYKEIKRGSQN